MDSINMVFSYFSQYFYIILRVLFFKAMYIKELVFSVFDKGFLRYLNSYI